MIMNDYCSIEPKHLSDNMPKKYKELLLSNYILYNKIKTLCTIIPQVSEKEQDKIKPIIENLVKAWKKNDLELTIAERQVQPIDEYNREFRVTTNNMGQVSMHSGPMEGEEVISCPSNAEFDPYEFIAVNLEPSNRMFITEYFGKNSINDYNNMNYHITNKNTDELDGDMFF